MVLPKDLILNLPDAEDEKDIRHLGPAMLALTKQEQTFVWAALEIGKGDSFPEAARVAGYPSHSKDALNARARRLTHRPDIQKAFNEELRKRMTAHLPLAVGTLLTVMKNEQADDKNRLKATEMFLNRVQGWHEIREEKHMVEVRTVDDNEMIRQIRLTIKDMKLSDAEARKLLGDRAEEILDGVFTEVAPLALGAPETEEARAARELDELLR